MVMIMTNIADAKAKLSEYLEAAGRGERVVICRHNRPVAELRAVAATPVAKRKLGTAAGRVVIPPSFFEPLSDDLLDAFEGKTEDVKPGSRVAEAKARYRTGKARRRG
jgi:prevent-host-death family protein